jgi:hypothetical protein
VIVSKIHTGSNFIILPNIPEISANLIHFCITSYGEFVFFYCVSPVKETHFHIAIRSIKSYIPDDRAFHSDCCKDLKPIVEI